MNTPDIVPAIFLGMKFLALVGLVVYMIFAGIIVRQEQLMADVLEHTFEPMLRSITIIHFIAAVAVFLLALVLL